MSKWCITCIPLSRTAQVCTPVAAQQEKTHFSRVLCPEGLPQGLGVREDEPAHGLPLGEPELRNPLQREAAPGHGERRSKSINQCTT